MELKGQRGGDSPSLSSAPNRRVTGWFLSSRGANTGKTPSSFFLPNSNQPDQKKKKAAKHHNNVTMSRRLQRADLEIPLQKNDTLIYHASQKSEDGGQLWNSVAMVTSLPQQHWQVVNVLKFEKLERRTPTRGASPACSRLPTLTCCQATRLMARHPNSSENGLGLSCQRC